MPRKNKFATNIDLAKVLRKKHKIKEEIAKKIIASYFREIKSALLKNETVSLNSFGSFNLTKWKSQEIYSINEKKKVTKELKTVTFKPSPQIKKRLYD